MNRIFVVVILFLGFCIPSVPSWAGLFSCSTDPLAPRDEWGLLHQSPVLNSTDFERRHHWRASYYFESRTSLMADPAYVGALQTTLRRLGYYCGETDGVFTPELSDAIEIFSCENPAYAANFRLLSKQQVEWLKFKDDRYQTGEQGGMHALFG